VRLYPTILILALAASPASADDTTIRFGAAPPPPFTSRMPDAKIIHLPPRDPDPAWLAYCEPRAYFDRYGVTRFHYAKPGCEFGITGPREGD